MLYHTLKLSTYKRLKSVKGQKYYSTSLDKNGEDKYEQYIRETVTKMNEAEFECLINDLKLYNKAYDFSKILTANMKRENKREVIIVLLQLGRESLVVPKIISRFRESLT